MLAGLLNLFSGLSNIFDSYMSAFGSLQPPRPPFPGLPEPSQPPARPQPPEPQPPEPEPPFPSEPEPPAPIPGIGLADPEKKEIAAQITSSFENSTLELQYDYAENIGDGRGITAGRAGFTSGTSDLLLLVEEYTQDNPGNVLARYLPALRAVDGTESTRGLAGFEQAFNSAADTDPNFRALQDELVDRLYFEPAMGYAESVGVESALGQAILWDTLIQHGEDWEHGTDVMVAEAGPITAGEEAWLVDFLEIRRDHLLESYEPGEASTSNSRINAFRSLIEADEWNLDPPITWNAYGENFTITG